MGVVGVAAPRRQAVLLGYRPPQDATATPLLMISSIAAINNGLLYLIGAHQKWAGFPRFTVGARALMGAGLWALAAHGGVPRGWRLGAAWELIGAAVTAGALRISTDRRS